MGLRIAFNVGQSEQNFVKKQREGTMLQPLLDTGAELEVHEVSFRNELLGNELHGNSDVHFE